MSIAKPGRRLLAGVKLPFVARKIAGGGQRAVTASLSLTSMIDFLVVTVVFLLLSFRPSEAGLERGVNVPPAESTLDMIDAPMVTVVGGEILLDGARAGSTRAVVEGKTLAHLDELGGALRAKRETWKLLHPNKPVPGTVILQIDQDVPSSVIKSVFQTAARSGYPNVSFMVRRAG